MKIQRHSLSRSTKLYLSIGSLIITLWGPAYANNCQDNQSEMLSPKKPLGMKESALQETIDVFLKDPLYKDMSVMIMYGSRLHHEAGYKPQRKSDLDVTFLSNKEMEPLDRANLSLESAAVFKSASENAGFKIAEEIPFLETTLSVMADRSFTRFTSKTRQNEKVIWEKIEEAQIPREAAKAKFLEELGGFSKDSLFVFKSTVPPEFLTYLQQRWYENWIFAE